MSIGSTISLVIEVSAVVFLVWAVARRGLVRPTAVPRRPMIAVVGTVVVALVLAFVFDVPDPLPWLTGLLLVLLALTRLEDARFWRGLLVLGAIFTVFGLMLTVALGLTIVKGDYTGFFGVTRLTALGGPDLNPGYGWWWAPALSTAVLKFALPNSLTLVLGWLVATRSELTKLERLGLVLAAARFAALGFEAPFYTFAYLVLGSLAGVPAWRIALGAVPATALIVLLGTGGLAGLLTGGKAVFSGIPVVKLVSETRETLSAFVTALRTKRGDAKLDDRGLTTFLGESLRPGFRRVVAVLAVIAVPFALSLISVLNSPARAPEEVAVEHVAEQIKLPGAAVAHAYQTGPEELWLHRNDNTVARVDLRSGNVTEVAVDASGVTVSGGHVYALLPGARSSRVVEITNDGKLRDIAAALPLELRGSLAVTKDMLYVGLDDGTTLALTRPADPTGKADVAAEVRDEGAVARIMTGGGAVWTMHDRPDGGFRAVLRDARTLRPAADQSLFGVATDLVVDENGEGAMVIGSVALPYPGSPAETPSAPVQADAALPEGPDTDSGPLLNGPGTLVPSSPGDDAWVSFPFPVGRVFHFGTDEVQIHDFAYDHIAAVAETSTGTWLVVTRNDWLLGAVHTGETSYLVKWER